MPAEPSTPVRDAAEPETRSDESEDTADDLVGDSDGTTTSTEADLADDLTGAAADDETALADAPASTGRNDEGGLGAGPIVGVLVVLAVTAGAIRERRRRAPA
jgi:hypothetical protein